MSDPTSQGAGGEFGAYIALPDATPAPGTLRATAPGFESPADSVFAPPDSTAIVPDSALATPDRVPAAPESTATGPPKPPRRLKDREIDSVISD